MTRYNNIEDVTEEQTTLSTNNETKICIKCGGKTELLDMADNDSLECFNCARERILNNSEFYQLTKY